MAEETQVAGINIGDAAIAARTEESLQRTEDMLYEGLKRGHDLPTATASYLAQAGGKRFRPLTVFLAAQVVLAQNSPELLAKPLPENVIKAATVVEMVHLASLYHDDVMDEAEQRRGAESANSRWDNSVAILAGDYLFACASMFMADLGSEAVRITSQTFLELVNGQMEETIHAGDQGSIDTYLRVIDGKTASLIATAGLFGAREAGGSQVQQAAMEKAARAIGMAFQIVDDIIDIASDSDQSGKTPGTDLREGVFTLPVLYALEQEDEVGDRLRTILTGPVEDEELVSEALHLLRNSEGMKKALGVVHDYRNMALEAISVFAESPARTAFERLIEFTVARAG